MRYASKTQIQGRALHPMVVWIPATLMVLTLVGYAGFASSGDPTWLRNALWANLAAVLSAVVAAVPGFVDWLLVVPLRHPAKKLGAAHMTLNLGGVGLLAANLYVHREALEAACYGGIDRFRTTSPELPVGLSACAVAMLVTSAALGRILFHRYHIGMGPADEPRRGRASERPGAPAGGPLAPRAH